ncbi:phosphoribosylaminoimidazole carboxylase, ATPase subunit [Planoprotostelium fungivorum]|uniref:phosphoribosylaminoimidazole carboxylase n=1 Tax=Planoprotostelium fungivorum TaxID=1890364 RepID=A0A2P6NG03_9EUKA|nr:phosphoribosylaminoimidazole carboxylase, ATPase subunit [Planoprotostelium fungivorum]
MNEGDPLSERIYSDYTGVSKKSGTFGCPMTLLLRLGTSSKFQRAVSWSDSSIRPTSVVAALIDSHERECGYLGDLSHTTTLFFLFLYLAFFVIPNDHSSTYTEHVRWLFITEGVGQIFLGLSAHVEIKRDMRYFEHNIWGLIAWFIFSITSACRFVLALSHFGLIETDFRWTTAIVLISLSFLYIYRSKTRWLFIGIAHLFPSVILFAFSFLHLYLKDGHHFDLMGASSVSAYFFILIIGNFGIDSWYLEVVNLFLWTALSVSFHQKLVGVIMGSQSDWPDTMKFAASTLEELGVSFEVNIVSAHRTPERLFEYAKTARSRGLKVIIAGAGGAAHLPGMVAALTPLPVLGVPVQSKALSGMDSLLSIAQMPGEGIPVGTLAIGRSGAINAALLAASILASSGNHPDISQKYDEYRSKQTESVNLVPVDESAKSLLSHATSSFTPTSNTSSTSEKKVETTEKIVTKDRSARVMTGGNIGIIGGGQLAKMSAIAAAYLGYKVWIYAPEEDPPASHSCYKYVRAEYDDAEALRKFAESVDVITYEFENIPPFTLQTLDKYSPVRPKPQVNAICQDRYAEKSFVKNLGIATAPFEKVKSLEELKESLSRIGFPSVLKSNNFGYDGKGQHTIKQESDIPVAWEKMESVKSESAILEGFVNFTMEVSVLVARTLDGQKKTFPVVENRHENHILKQTIVPAQVSEETKKKATDIALAIAEAFDLVGLVAVEMFIKADGSVVVNEMAPRPHNSGHWSIEGCQTSQFQQHIRAVCGLPLGDTEPLGEGKWMMENLLGDEINQWMKRLEDGESVHVYGKPEIKPGRKLGHSTRAQK